ncbi:MAG: ATP-dependent RNA helicase RhlE [Candidatus Magasanikbacteria bacterium]|nr:ATP-dependent RNA helicase RhlE [Candidatus Magasanikbacteria bacterium]
MQETHGSVLIFSRTKHGARKMTSILRAAGHSAAEIHSNRSLAQRREALDGFKKGKYRILVATDIAARGIDVKGIELVLNFDLPDSSEDYVHRIGRTGRAGHAGRAISFATPDQSGDVRAIERLIRMPLTVKQMPGYSASATANFKTPPSWRTRHVSPRDLGRNGRVVGTHLRPPVSASRTHHRPYNFPSRRFKRTIM